MTRLQLDRPDEKSLRFSGVSAGVARCLFDLPDVLRLRDQPGPARRLFRTPPRTTRTPTPTGTG